VVHNVRRALLAVILLAIFLTAACGSPTKSDSNEPIKSAGVLRVGTEGVYAPYSFHDASQGGQLAGYDVDPCLLQHVEAEHLPNPDVRLLQFLALRHPSPGSIAHW